MAEFVCYDAENSGTLQSFEIVRNNTACIFAKKSKLWGSADYNPSKDIGNVWEVDSYSVAEFVIFGRTTKSVISDSF